MHRAKYDKKTISVYDTVGSYFVDMYYNNHYLFANKLVTQGKAATITDAYRDVIINYMNGIVDRKDLYKKFVTGLHEYYQRVSGFGSVVFADFEDLFLTQFIPPEYYRDFTDTVKDHTLHKILVTTANEFGRAVLQQGMLFRIIDNHKNAANIVSLQDKIVDIFILQREEYYSKFANEIAQKHTGSTVSKNLVEKIKAALIDEKRLRCKLEQDYAVSMNMISQLVAKYADVERNVNAREMELASLRGEADRIGELENQCGELRARCSQLTHEKSVLESKCQQYELRILSLTAAKQSVTPIETLPALEPSPIDNSSSSESEEDYDQLQIKRQQQMEQRRRELLAEKQLISTEPVEETPACPVDDDSLAWI